MHLYEKCIFAAARETLERSGALAGLSAPVEEQCRAHLAAAWARVAPALATREARVNSERMFMSQYFKGKVASI